MCRKFGNFGKIDQKHSENENEMGIVLENKKWKIN